MSAARASPRACGRRWRSPARWCTTRKLIILDEPLTGLDAGSARQVKNVLRERVARRRHRHHDHAHPRSRRAHGRPHRRHRRRPADRRGHARRTAPRRPARPRPAWKTPSSRWSPSEPPPRERARHTRLARRATSCASAGATGCRMMTAGRRAARAHRRDRARRRSPPSCICSPTRSSARYADVGADADKATLVVITGTLLLSWSLMLSQAMESVTRAFYARSDLDLILSSPVVGAQSLRRAHRRAWRSSIDR